uniref:SANT domain-containing protein n=1 Tax=Strigamia maritima TaxID=126957 RepID=T1J3Z7_STRMM
MVKRKRLSTATGCEETTTELNANGMIVDCGSPTKESANKKATVISVNREPSCCNTRSKLKGTFETIQPKLLLNDGVINSEESDAALLSKQQGKLTITRSSSRTHKKPVRDVSPLVQQSPRKSEKSQGKSGDLPEGKTRRSWELWSVEDKNAFFDALCEYGKDFDSIQHFIAQKNKKKNHLPQMIKNKDQIIDERIDASFNLDVKKHTQELYGLINYGELRKKLGGCMDEKNGQKLNELVHNGATTIRFKGKNVRVKTPLCRALKRLNVVDDPKDDDHPKLPQKITIELRPQNLTSWTRVQSLAQNPRLRLTVSLQRRLATIIEFLQSKWRSNRLKTKEHLQTTASVPVNSNDDDGEMNDVIRLLPSKESAVTLVTLRETNDSATSASISLHNYRQNVIPKGQSEAATGSKKGTRPTSRSRIPEDINKRVNFDEDATLASDVALKLLSSKETEKKTDWDVPVPPYHEDALKQLLALTPGTAGSRVSEKNEEIMAVDVVQSDNELKEKAVDQVERFRLGWNAEECHGMTVGELFLQLGSPNKMVLEYFWESKKRNDEPEKANETVLSKLVQFATLTFADVVTKNKNPNSECVSCRCGHICLASGMNSGKTNIIRSPISARNAKNKCVPVKTQTIISSSADQPQFLVPRMAAPHSRTQFNRSSPVMQHNTTICDNSFKEQLDKLTHRKARGRVRKSVVVQRELLPKTNLAHSVMTLRIVPTTSQVAGSFVPVLQQPTVAISKDLKFTQTQVIANTLPITSSTSSTYAVNAPTSVNSLPQISPAALNLSSLVNEAIANDVARANLNPNSSVLELSIPDHTTTLSGNAFSASPPSISLLDLPSCEVMQSENMNLPLEHADKLLDITLASSGSSFSAFNLTPSTVSGMKGPSLPCLGVDSVPDCPIDQTPITNSPFKNADNIWLSGETGDLSLSSLLGHLESPLKNPITQALGIINEDHPACGKLSSDVDNQLLCMLNENSVDYVAKFADLAAQIAVAETPKKVTSPTQIQ